MNFSIHHSGLSDTTIADKKSGRRRGPKADMYRGEHAEFFESIQNGRP